MHIIPRLYTCQIDLCVGSVGKLGRVNRDSHSISNSPELHSEVLENKTTKHPYLAEQDKKDIHFSGHNYGYYCY